jgi:triosephosphate isomerase
VCSSDLGFVAQPNIDGGLVGGASLEPASFAALLDEARKGALA